MKIRQVYLDTNVLVIHKPAGITVYPEDPKILDAQTLCKQQFGKNLFPVHRLDKTTCGLLVFAFDNKAARLLQDAFKQRRVKKKYQLICFGPLEKDMGRFTQSLNKKGGPPESALTEYSVLKKKILGDHEICVVECDPKTGRFHQIRKHFAFGGAPLVGDALYLKNKERESWSHAMGADRPMLSSVEISFTHPINKKILKLSTKPDPDFLNFLKKI
jgi:tRNA pseudouridine65 synthase